MLRILSLGAGVQSSTLLLMALEGEVPLPEHAIFADTGWEPPAVYEWLGFLKEKMEGRIQFHQVSRGNIRDSFYTAMSTGKRYVSLPVFVRNPDGSQGMGRRQCTKEFKIEPIQKKVREILGVKPRSPGPKEVVVEQWMGISADELGRLRASTTRWIRFAFPLVDRNMTRRDCLKWMESHGYPRPPKSSCLGCPYHGDHQWREIKADPALWADVVEFDRMIRHGGPRGVLIGENYLHKSLVPLDEVDLTTDEEKGQIPLFDEGMQQECEGMCGL